ncbi:MAG: TlpA disulfide reductase family protein [Pseudomonadota bacterium]
MSCMAQALVVLFLLASACATTSRGPRVAELSLWTLEGRETSAAQLPGRVLVLYLLTTGCDACLADQNKLRALDEQFAGRGLQIVLVAMDPDNGRVVRIFADALGSPFPVLRAGPGLAAGSSPLGPVVRVPRVIVVDAARRVVWDREGVQAYEDLARAIGGALDTTPDR